MVMVTVTIFVILLAIISAYYLRNRHTIPVMSTFDGNVYNVLKDIQDPVESANILAELNAKTETLIKYLEQNNKDHIVTQCMSKKYSPSILSEAKIQSGYTTYTINKSDIHVCVRTRDDNKKAYDINLLMYVLLHELAHVCNDTIGHDDKFKRVFSFLVKKAIEVGVYKFDNYHINPKEYCGMTLNSSIV
jgi:hypothetical protein